MLINLQSIAKTIGTKTLYEGLSVTIQAGEKVGVVGRNGIGKTTLLGIMAATDKDFSGQIDRRRGLVVASTSQEHHDVMDRPVLEYVLENLPEYAALKIIIDTYPDTMGDDLGLISHYTDALNRFGELGYYDIEERARQELRAFQISEARFAGPMSSLSGGQKRLVELTKVTLSDADLALIDEPTNHMDYVAKAAFIDWLKAAQQAVVVITHDRDVLGAVDRIIEVKDRSALSFKGNYDAYLKQNGAATAKAIESYEQGQKRMVKLDKQIREAKTKKASWSGTADKTNPFMLLERRLTKERDELSDRLQRPDFWIDQETIADMQDKVVARYEKYKSRNIRLGVKGEHRARQLLVVDHLSLGFAGPLFQNANLALNAGERLRLHGRNGVGKSTLVQAILAQAAGHRPASKTYDGTIELDPKLTIGIYEQEINERFLNLPLGAAIVQIHHEHGVPVNEQRVKQLLADYLFDPQMDGRLEIKRLSGGQKARFQLIAMLCHQPNMLILDEPTNHLDLPSIEELEKALDKYTGAVLYISHDSFFARNVGGETIEIVPVPELAKAT